MKNPPKYLFSQHDEDLSDLLDGLNVLRRGDRQPSVLAPGIQQRGVGDQTLAQVSKRPGVGVAVWLPDKLGFCLLSRSFLNPKSKKEKIFPFSSFAW